MSGVLAVPAIASAQTQLYLGTDASPSVFTSPLGRLGNIDGPNSSAAVVDVSNQTSTRRRKLATLVDSGQLTAILYWEPSQTEDQQLYDLFAEAPPVLRSWQIIWPDGTIWLFNAYLTKFAPKADIAKELNAAITLDIDDDIAVTYAH